MLPIPRIFFIFLQGLNYIDVSIIFAGITINNAACRVYTDTELIIQSKKQLQMKKIFLLAAFSAAIGFAEAQQLKTPAPSPLQTVKQEFGLSAVELSYSRPAVKGRTIFGDLVPYGEIWRTSATLLPPSVLVMM